MAAKPKAKKETTVKTAKPRAPKKGDDETSSAGIGHNYRIDGKKAKTAFDRLDRLHKEKQEANAGYMADINTAYEQGATALGIPEKILKKEYRKHKMLMSLENDYANLEPDERDMIDSLDLALGQYKDTPLGRFAMEREELRAAVANDAADAGEEKETPVPDFD